LVDVTQEQAKPLLDIGMLTDAVFSDIDNDNDLDLITVGDWMPITVFENKNYAFTKYKEIPNSTGWWNRIVAADFNNDGTSEFVCGNFGLNNKFANKPGKQVHLYANDFDNNNTLDIVLAKNYNGNLVPVRGKECSSEQMPFINTKYTNYEAFAYANLNNIFDATALRNAIQYTTNQLQSCMLINKQNGDFELQALPNQVQTFPVKGISILDLNGDNHQDIIMAGNHYNTEVETIRYDAGLPTVLLGNGDLTFSPLTANDTGVFDNHDFRDVINVMAGNKITILISSNNSSLKAYQL